MYDFDMDGYYYKGYSDIFQDNFNLENHIYICLGVIFDKYRRIEIDRNKK